MQQEMLDRFYAALENLERAIQQAQTNLTTREGVPQEILDRLKSHADVCVKQREYGVLLKAELDKGNHEEAARLFRLINGLSGMIAEDVAGMIATLRAGGKKVPTVTPENIV